MHVHVHVRAPQGRVKLGPEVPPVPLLPRFGCSAAAQESDGAASIIQPPPSCPALPVPKATGIPGGHQRSSFRGAAPPAPGWPLVHRLTEGGDNVFLIDWASWGECRNFPERDIWDEPMWGGG